MTTSLVFTHLRFDVVARTPIRLGEYQAGERLRDALAQVMLRAVCPEMPRASQPSPEHAAVCPVCWLLAFAGKQAAQGAEVGDVAGEVRRAYSLIPPLPPLDIIEAGQPFAFGLTLFGSGHVYLPYFVLAAAEAGRVGVGPGRGTFALQAIWAVNPWADGRAADEAVLLPGENLARLPQPQPAWEFACQAAERWHQAGSSTTLQVEYLTPTRLVEAEALVKAPDFGVFFRRLLERIDDLRQQYAGEARRPAEHVAQLYALADQVRLVEANTRWVDLWGPSGRTGRRTPMGGFVGTAAYRSAHWDVLLPWLLLGQGVQAGKLAAKGNGVFQVLLPGQAAYWT